MTETDPATIEIAEGVQIPGNGWQYVLDSSYPTSPRWHRITGTTRRYGRHGFAFVLDALRGDDALDLFEYMESAAGAQESALGDQRGDPENYASVRRDAVGLRTGADRLQAALRAAGVEALSFDEKIARGRSAREAATR